MAAARDQAARILRTEPNAAESDSARDASAALADSMRAHLPDESVARRPAEVPERPGHRQAGGARGSRRVRPRRNRASANSF